LQYTVYYHGTSFNTLLYRGTSCNTLYYHTSGYDTLYTIMELASTRYYIVALAVILSILSYIQYTLYYHGTSFNTLLYRAVSDVIPDLLQTTGQFLTTMATTTTILMEETPASLKQGECKRRQR
ncbi:hypothetical protein CHS0354_010535, partial [Potamilus streckersoni]